MAQEQKTYRYADRNEQIKRTNRFMVVGYIIFYLVVTAIVWISGLRGFRSMGYCMMLTVIALTTTAITMTLYAKMQYSNNIKYIAFIGLMLVTFLISYAFNNYYLRFMADFHW